MQPEQPRPGRRYSVATRAKVRRATAHAKRYLRPARRSCVLRLAPPTATPCRLLPAPFAFPLVPACAARAAPGEMET